MKIGSTPLGKQDLIDIYGQSFIKEVGEKLYQRSKVDRLLAGHLTMVDDKLLKHFIEEKLEDITLPYQLDEEAKIALVGIIRENIEYKVPR